MPGPLPMTANRGVFQSLAGHAILSPHGGPLASSLHQPTSLLPAGAIGPGDQPEGPHHAVPPAGRTARYAPRDRRPILLRPARPPRPRRGPPHSLAVGWRRHRWDGVPPNGLRPLTVLRLPWIHRRRPRRALPGYRERADGVSRANRPPLGSATALLEVPAPYHRRGKSKSRAGWEVPTPSRGARWPAAEWQNRPAAATQGEGTEPALPAVPLHLRDRRGGRGAVLRRLGKRSRKVWTDCG